MMQNLEVVVNFIKSNVGINIGQSLNYVKKMPDALQFI